MKLALALAVVAAFSACKRSSEETAVSVPIKEVVAGVPMIDFEAIETKFSARVPADWGVQQKYLDPKKGVSLSGPKQTYILIYKYPEMDPYSDARKYAETFWQLDPKGKQPDITTEKIGDNTIIRFHQERSTLKLHSKTLNKPVRHDYALIPIKGGFFQIMHQAPEEDYKSTLPVFEAVVRSFKPKP